MPARGYTAYLILRFLTESRSDPNYPIGFTANFLSSHVSGIRSQTWLRMQELLDGFEKKEYVQKIHDGVTRQSHYRITDRGVATYLRWKPVIEEWIDQSYFGSAPNKSENDQLLPRYEETKPQQTVSIGE